MPRKGYVHPKGIPGVMQKEFSFPTGNMPKDQEGYSGPSYKKKTMTAKGHTRQSQQRADRLKGREFMKKFKGRTRPILV